MRVLVACEYSGRVRDAFIRAGHDAMSCDLLPTEHPGPHYQGDVRDVLCDGWDLLIAHPPCTHLAVSGARWFKLKTVEQADALSFVRLLLDAPIKKKALENPISIISSRIRKPDQIIHPHMFGHPEFKATCLWTEGLPLLQATEQLDVPLKGSDAYKAWEKVHRMPPSPDRWRHRSRTYPGIADAMALQWGGI